VAQALYRPIVGNCPHRLHVMELRLQKARAMLGDSPRAA
jgi:hypothetical protein